MGGEEIVDSGSQIGAQLMLPCFLLGVEPLAVTGLEDGLCLGHQSISM